MYCAIMTNYDFGGHHVPDCHEQSNILYGTSNNQTAERPRTCLLPALERAGSRYVRRPTWRGGDEGLDLDRIYFCAIPMTMAR